MRRGVLLPAGTPTCLLWAGTVTDPRAFARGFGYRLASLPSRETIARVTKSAPRRVAPRRRDGDDTAANSCVARQHGANGRVQRDRAAAELFIGDRSGWDSVSGYETNR